jgi:hypothetical protein
MAMIGHDGFLNQVEFAYNDSRALGIDHFPFQGKNGFNLEEPRDLFLPMRPSILVSMVAQKRLQHKCMLLSYLFYICTKIKYKLICGRR